MKTPVLVTCYIIVLISVGYTLSYGNVTIKPLDPHLWENTSLTLSCEINGTSTFSYMYWILNDIRIKVNLENNQCSATEYPLNKTDLYTLRCNGSNNFAITIKRVDRQQHGDEWRCVVGFVRSITVHIFVKVPVQTVDIRILNANVIEENQTVQADCVTSYSRPMANIQWFLSNGTSALNDNMRIAADTLVLYVNKTVEHEENTHLNRGNILTATRSELIYTAQRWMNGLVIFCAANNSLHSSVLSMKKILNITYPPDGPPYIRGFKNGQTYSVINKFQGHLSCSVKGGNPHPHLKWNCSVDGIQVIYISNMAVTNNITLKASSEHLENCICWSIYRGSISSVTIQINVLYPPSTPTMNLYSRDVNNYNILGSVNIMEKESFNLTCLAESNPPSSYSWTGPISSSSGLLQVHAVDRNLAGTFTCIAHNVMVQSDGNRVEGTNNSSVHLNVLYAPVVHHLQNITVIERSDLRITCRVTPGNPNITHFRWTKDGDDIIFNTSIFHLTNVSRTDDMVYTCSAHNIMRPSVGSLREGNSSASFHLNVLYPTYIDLFFLEGFFSQDIVELNQATEVKLICRVSSNPKSNLTLTFGNRIIHTITQTDVFSYSHILKSCSDSGLYTCYGENGLGQPATKKLEILVKCSPELSPETPFKRNLRSILYVPTTFSFNGLAYPEPGPGGFRWYKFTSAGLESITSNSKFQISSSGLSSNLTIKNVTIKEYGQYKIHVENEMGSLEVVLTLFPYGKPESPSGFKVIEESITETKATVQWEGGFNGGLEQTFVLSYRDEERTDDEEEQENVTVKDYGGESINLTLAGLESSSTYQLQLFSVNSIGRSSSVYTSFHTKDTVEIRKGSSSRETDIVIGCLVSILVLAVASVIIVLTYRRYFKKKQAKERMTGHYEDICEMPTISGNNQNA